MGKMNHKNNPDTMMIDHLLSYRIVAHTIPPVSIDNVIIKPGKHNVIGMETPQGKLIVKMRSKIKYNYIVRPIGIDTTLNVQAINETEDYIIGDYQIELLSIPSVKKRVRIGQDSTATLLIPTPASVNIQLPSKGFGGVYHYRNKGWKQVWHFRKKKKQHKLTLLPGKYKIIYRADAAKDYFYTSQQTIILEEGDSKWIKF